MKLREIYLKARKFCNTHLIKDTIILTKVGDEMLKINRKHQLPHYLSKIETYSKNLPRLAVALSKKYVDLKIIDIGANIGDTVALVHSKIAVPMLCIEGDELFFSLLDENSKKFKKIKTVKTFLGEFDETISGETQNDIGSLQIKKTTGKKIQLKTLDSILAEQVEFVDSKLIKIDTDGYDFKILRGAMGYVSKIKPVIFMELDRFLLDQAHDSAPETLKKLNEIGYEKIFFYDNNGRFILSTNLSDAKLIAQLYYYTYKKKGSIPYYDIVLFHKDDIDIAESFESSEKNI